MPRKRPGNVSRNVNVRSSSWFHFSDWNGNSGHPLWMSNVMMPRLLKVSDQKEKNLRRIEIKAKEKSLTERKRHAMRLHEAYFDLPNSNAS